MAIDYKTWLQKTGKPSNAASSMQWKKTHGAALGKYNKDGTNVAGPRASAQAATAPDAPQYDTPKFVPGAMDARGIAEGADIDYVHKLAGIGAGRDRDLSMSEIAAQRVDADRMQAKAQVQNRRNHGARGTGLSGLKVHDRGEIDAERVRQEGQFSRASQAVANAYQNQMDQADAQKRIGNTQNKHNTEDRRMAQFQSNYPNRLSTSEQAAAENQAPGAPPIAKPATQQKPPPKKPQVSYAQFVKSHGGKSTKKLSTAWKKRFA